ncbi:MAG: STAS domain-containing protein [Sulfurimonas sp.]
MNKEFKVALLDIIQNDSDQLINDWIVYFDADAKDDEYRHYDDFLGFFEECIETGLNPKSDEAQALLHFLEKLKEIIGEEKFFHFQDSVYTCFLKFPLLKVLEQRNLFSLENVKLVTQFFEALTSGLIIKLLSHKKIFQEESIQELSDREAPISEIWDGVLMVSIVGTLDSQRVLQIIDKVLNHLEQDDFSSVIVDISAIFDVNSEVANQLMKLNNAIKFMGSEAYTTGVTANIAKSLTHLDVNLGDVKTYTTTKKAMHEILGKDN